MKVVFAVGCCVFLLALTVHAEEELARDITSLSLGEAIQRALKKNPGYRGALSNARAAEGLTYQSGLWENPVLFGQTEEWPIEKSFEESRYFFGISQIIPFPGKKRLDRTAAFAEETARKSQSDDSRIDLIRRVRIAFYQVLAAEKLVSVSENLASIADSSVETATERLEAGVSTAQEVLRAEVQAERVKNAQLSFLRNLNVARNQLALTTGQTDLTNISLEGELVEEIPSDLLKIDKDKIEKEHPQILAAEARVRRSLAIKERADLDSYPDLTLRVSGGRREVNDETLVDFGFSVPLPILNRSRGEVLAASEGQRKAKNELEQIKQTVITQLTNEIETLKQAAQQVKNYKERLIPQSESALRLVQTGFREGEYGFNDLLDTQRTVAEAKIEYLKSLFAFNRSIAEVRSLTEFEEAF